MNNILGKAFVAAALVIAGVIVISDFRQTNGDGKSSPRVTRAPAEPIRAALRHNRAGMDFPDETASTRRERGVANDDPVSPDNLEDPDQLRAWARRNPQEARDWLDAAAEGTRRETVLEMVCLQIAETNAAGAVVLADSYGAGCSNLLENLVVQWADRDVEAAFRWADAKGPGGLRDGLLSRIAFVESKTDPNEAATLVAEQIAPGPVQDEAAMSVIYQWALKDPDAAMNWAQSFSAGTLHDRAVNEVQKIIVSNSP